MHCKVGLCVIDSATNQIIVLKRSTPYNDSLKTNSGGFVEEYCIPRGGLKHENETYLECGIREFVEECQIFFSEFYILPETFDLRWSDPPHKIWQYKILFLLVSMKNHFPVLPLNVRAVTEKICEVVNNIELNEFYNECCCKKCKADVEVRYIQPKVVKVTIPDSVVALAKTNSLEANNIPVSVQNQILMSKNLSSLMESNKSLRIFRKDIKKFHNIKRENIYMMIMHVRNYYILMNKRLKLYSSSNYADFFIFIERLLFIYKIHNVIAKSKPYTNSEQQ